KVCLTCCKESSHLVGYTVESHDCNMFHVAVHIHCILSVNLPCVLCSCNPVISKLIFSVVILLQLCFHLLIYFIIDTTAASNIISSQLLQLKLSLDLQICSSRLSQVHSVNSI